MGMRTLSKIKYFVVKGCTANQREKSPRFIFGLFFKTSLQAFVPALKLLVKPVRQLSVALHIVTTQ